MKDQIKDRKRHKSRPNSSQRETRRSAKRRLATDDEDDDDVDGPKDPKRSTFMAAKVPEKVVNEAFGKDVESNLATFGYIPAMMGTKTLSIRDVWFVDSG